MQQNQEYSLIAPIIKAAGKLAQTFRDEGLNIESKGRQDFVSQADVEVERFLKEKLTALFPHDGFLGEEGGLQSPINDEKAENGKTGIWVIDPIDGTTNYINGMDYWCISVAYVVADSIELGFIYAPDRDEFFFAKRGYGAYCNNTKLVIKEPELGHAIIGIGRSNRRPIQEYLSILSQLDAKDVEHRRFGAGALMLAHVALGLVHGYYEAHMHSWDALAGALLIEEANGKVNNFLANNGLIEGNLVWMAAPQLWTLISDE